uniref:Uncharacterized protein n=1 Tax=Glossina palpalis gambiensis TaxID=67801 RepID=A0A1B0BFY1_9MUSC
MKLVPETCSELVLTSRAAIASGNHLFGQHTALYRIGQNSDETESTSDLLCYCPFLAIRTEKVEKPSQTS